MDLATTILFMADDDNEGAKGFIKTMFSMIFGSDVGSGSKWDFAQGYDQITAKGWMLTDVMDVVTQLMNDVFAPAVSVFLTVVFTINFFKVLLSLDGNDSSGGVQRMIQVVIKYAILVLLANNAIMIVKSIAAIIDALVNKAATGYKAPPTIKHDGSEIEGAINGLGTIDSIVLIIILLIPFLIAVAANLAVYVVVILRLAEFIMLAAAAPVPVAFMGDDDTKSIAIGYLKKLGSIGLQAVLLLFISSVLDRFGSALTSGDFNGVTSDTLVATTAGNFIGFLVLPIIQLVLVFATGKLSRAIMGE